MKRVYRIPALLLMVLVLASIHSAFTSSLGVTVPAIDDISVNVTANDFLPPECAGMNVVNLIIQADGDQNNNLILGGPNADALDGRAGDDCIVGGGGADDLVGGAGNDVLLGGPGDDDLNGGAFVDACYGEGGTDTFNRSCETQVQD